MAHAAHYEPFRQMFPESPPFECYTLEDAIKLPVQRAPTRPIIQGRCCGTFKKWRRFVYVIQHGEQSFYKIGLADRPWFRISQLQVGTPIDLTCLFVIPEIAPDHEPAMHMYFEEWHIRGEWFYGAPELLEFIEWGIAQANAQEAVECTPAL